MSEMSDMGGAPDGTRIKTAEKEGWAETWARYDTDQTWAIIDELRAIADELDAHPAQVAIRWVMQHPVITAPILGASRLEQLETNLAVLEIELTADHMQRLDDVSAIDGVYPYDSFIDDAQAGR